MQKVKYKRPVPNYEGPAKGRVSQALPDQSMSIQEIVERFVKGIPADIEQKQGVYDDQTEFDLEKLGALDNADKAFQASELKARNEAIARELEADQRARAQAVREDEADKKEREDAERAQSGIGLLDNTMPDDTDLSSSGLQKRQKPGGGKKPN